MATGLQDKFSWAGVAGAGVGAGIGFEFNARFGEDITNAFGERVAKTAQYTANSIANAATRSAIDGSNFGDNIIAAVPDVLGQMFGGMIGSEIGPLNLDKLGPIGAIVNFTNKLTGKIDAKIATVGETIAEAVKSAGGASRPMPGNIQPANSYELNINIPADSHYTGIDEVVSAGVRYGHVFDTFDGMMLANNILRSEALKRRQTLEQYYGQAERRDIALQGLRNQNIAFDRVMSGTSAGRVFNANQQAKALPGPNRGVIFVKEALGSHTAGEIFEAGTSGAMRDLATRQKVVPALRFDNPNPKGHNFIKLDGFELTAKGGLTLIDSKLSLVSFNKNGRLFIPDGGRLQNLSMAIKQNEGARVVFEFPNAAASDNARFILRRNLGIENITTRVRGK